MKMKNFEIYNYAQALNTAFTGKEIFPIKINFYLQKNIKTLMTATKEVDASRVAIGEKYGTPVENGYTILEENMAKAQEEYNDLMSLEQDLQIYTVKYTDLPDNLELTMEQMDALGFMIVEDEGDAE